MTISDKDGEDGIMSEAAEKPIIDTKSRVSLTEIWKCANKWHDARAEYLKAVGKPYWQRPFDLMIQAKYKLDQKCDAYRKHAAKKGTQRAMVEADINVVLTAAYAYERYGDTFHDLKTPVVSR